MIDPSNTPELGKVMSSPELYVDFTQKEVPLPVLHVSEVWDGRTDLRTELPPEIQQYLEPHQKVIYIHRPDIVLPTTALDAHDVMRQAVGSNGSIMASIDPFGGKSRYQYEHGRDAMKAAGDLYSTLPHLLKQVLVSLASSQGVENEQYHFGTPYGFEKPGSIILINRPIGDPQAERFEKLKGWTVPYFYASADAPATFVNNIARVHNDDPSFLWHGYTDKNGVPRLMADAFRLAVQWLTDRIDESPEGFVEYNNPVIGGGGMRNQGWQDSAHAMVHADGSWANSAGGIATLEIQGMTYDALRNAAQLYKTVFEDSEKASDLFERAVKLQKDTVEKFWVDTPDGGYFAPARDKDTLGQPRNLEVKKSSMGWLLATDMLKDDSLETAAKVRRTIEVLMAPDMLTRYGIRTMSSEAAAFTPFGYHTGSEWGQDLEVIAQGMSHHGYFGIDRLLGSRVSRKHTVSGVFYEHTSSYDTEEVQVPSRDTYVYDPFYNEVFLLEQVPPLAQTWEASAEVGKMHRYNHIPLTAVDVEKKAFEDNIFKEVNERV